MSIRRYTGRSRSRRSNPTGEWRRNPTPLKPKQFKKRMEQLEKLGLRTETKSQLEDLLPSADSSHSTYIFDFWKARLALLLVVGEEQLDPQKEGGLIDIIKKYAGKYFIHPYDCTLDDELQIDYYESLKHFIQLAANNPYFAASWAPLHRVTFVAPPTYSWQGEQRHIWLGRKKGTTRLSNRMYGLQGYAHDDPDRKEAAPAIRLLRGAYSGDPIDAERETEIPIELIYSDEKVMAPSDLIEYLTDMEENTVSAKFFVPDVHDPFMTFEDGKSWVIIHENDKSAESRSLNDCGEGQYSSESIVLLSLREPIPGTNPQQYKALLKAEVVFPSGTIGRYEYMDYRDLEDKVGIINQLRAHHNSKPGTKGPGHYQIIDRSLHNYIIDLLELPWVAHFSRPAYNPDDVFWPTDLIPRQIEYLKEKNEYLFDTPKFYEKFKELRYPYSLRNKITEGLEFPIPYVVETLLSITPQMIRERSIEESMIRNSLERAARAKERGDISDELLSLMDAAEARILQYQRGRLDVVDAPLERVERPMRDWLVGAGAEISYQEIYRIFKRAEEDPSKYPQYWSVAVSSLQKKIGRDDPDAASLKRLGSKLLALGFGQGLIMSGVTLNINQLKHVIKEKLVASREEVPVDAARRGADPAYETDQLTLAGIASWRTILISLRFISGTYMIASSRARSIISGGPPSEETMLMIVEGQLTPGNDGLTIPQATDVAEDLLEGRSYAKPLGLVAPLLRDLIIFSLHNRKFRNRGQREPIYGLIQKIMALPFSLSEKDIIDILKGAYETTSYTYNFGGRKTSFLTRKGFNTQHIPIYRAALISLDRKLNSPTIKSKKQLIAVAEKFLLAIKDEKLAKEVSKITELPMRDIIQVISDPDIHQTIRLTALDSLRKKINRGDRALRREALSAIKQHLSSTVDVPIISKIFDIYDGHKSRYELLYFLAIERIEWLYRNQNLFVKLIKLGLPSQEPGDYKSPRILPRSMYLLLRALILEEPKKYLSLIVRLLFGLEFDKESLKAVGRLIELALDRIIEDPNLLVSGSNDLCRFIEYERPFPSKLKLTPKLLQQFRILRNITLTIDDKTVDFLTADEIDRVTRPALRGRERDGTIGQRGTSAISAGAWKFIDDHAREGQGPPRDRKLNRSSCFLDLAVALAETMDKNDRKKMYGLIEPLVRSTLAGRKDYRPMINRLIG